MHYNNLCEKGPKSNYSTSISQRVSHTHRVDGESRADQSPGFNESVSRPHLGGGGGGGVHVRWVCTRALPTQV